MMAPIPSEAERLRWQLDATSELIRGQRRCTSPDEAARFASTIERLAASVQCAVEVTSEGEGLSVVTLATPRGQAFALGLKAVGL